MMLRQWKLQPLRRRLSRVGVSLRLVPIVAGVMVDETGVAVSAADAIVDGWMRFVSGSRRVAIAVQRRIRMRASISVLRLLRLSRLFCRVNRWASTVLVTRRLKRRSPRRSRLTRI